MVLGVTGVTRHPLARLEHHMPVILLVLLALLGARSARGQEPPASPAVAGQAVQEDTSATAPAGAGPPVSLDRIRNGLSKPAPRSMLDRLDRRPDFRVEVQLQARIEELLSTLDFRSGPKPVGGLYAYEQQQRVASILNNPMMQPYAAFGGAEVLTLLTEGLAARYIGGRAVRALSEWDRARALESARAEVARAIAEYCGARPDGGLGITICDKLER